jgi:prolyl oligopeptidase PreP (S9A serine peptidase family)
MNEEVFCAQKEAQKFFCWKQETTVMEFWTDQKAVKKLWKRESITKLRKLFFDVDFELQKKKMERKIFIHWIFRIANRESKDNMER